MKNRFSSMGLFLLAILVGCSTVPQATVDNSTERGNPRLTSMELEYTLGHSVYRIVTLGGWGKIRTEILSDAHLIREGELTSSVYEKLIQRADSLAQILKSRREPENLHLCRTPFTLILTRAEKKQTTQGCRGGPEGIEVGRLIKEVEFMLHSENSGAHTPLDGTPDASVEKGPVHN